MPQAPTAVEIDKTLAHRLSLVGGVLILLKGFSANELGLTSATEEKVKRYVYTHMSCALDTDGDAMNLSKGAVLGLFLSGNALLQEVVTNFRIPPDPKGDKGLADMATEKFKKVVAKLVDEDLAFIESYPDYFMEAKDEHFQI